MYNQKDATQKWCQNSKDAEIARMQEILGNLINPQKCKEMRRSDASDLRSEASERRSKASEPRLEASGLRLESSEPRFCNKDLRLRN